MVERVGMSEDRQSIPTVMYRRIRGKGPDGGPNILASIFPHPDDVPTDEKWYDSPDAAIAAGARGSAVADEVDPPSDTEPVTEPVKPKRGRRKKAD